MSPKLPTDAKRRDVARAVHMLRAALEPVDRAYTESRRRSGELLDALDKWARGDGPVPVTEGLAIEEHCAFPLALAIADLVDTVVEDDYPIAQWAGIVSRSASGCICEFAEIADRAVAASGLAELAGETSTPP